MKTKTPGSESQSEPNYQTAKKYLALESLFAFKPFSTENIYVFALLLVSSFLSINLQAQTPICETEPLPPEIESLIQYPDCTLESYDLMCIRVKFHYLDNDPARPSSAPGDAYFFSLLQRMNEELAPGKIRLTFDYNCIHRGEISGINESSDLSDLIDTNDPSIDFNPDAINVYFLQKFTTLTPFGSNPGKHVVVGFDDFTSIMHEVGHSLGLGHTFTGLDGDNSTLPPSPLGLLCKDINAVTGTTIKCQVAADGLCDTGIDPITHDLDQDNIRDGFMWVNLNTCTQNENLLPSIPDGCNDTITPWDVPVKNFMSYYKLCRTEFTPCQFGRMHEAMSLPALSTLILDCEEDPFAIEFQECTYADITISTIVTWTNQVKELCPGQRIIIKPTGHLVLNNTVITRSSQEAPIEACPDLFKEQLWDGIYIEGRGEYVLQGGTYYYLGGLTMKNSSVIEYSQSGIQGLKGYGKVEIENSALRHNRRQIALRDPWPYSFALESSGSNPNSYTNGSGLCGLSIFNPYPSVVIRNSTIEVGETDLFVEPLAATQILVDLGNTNITNSEITNLNSVNAYTDITAIKHARGNLSILNGTTIDHFNTGVFKGADVYNNCSGRGLNIQNSNIKNTITALYSTTQFVTAKHNYFNGNIRIEGLCYSNWYANRMKKGIPISTSMKSGYLASQSPEESCLLSENIFDFFSLDFYGKNENSTSLCNTWESMDKNYAVVGEEFVDFPESWGTFEQSAGNRHLDGLNHKPQMFSEDNLINYFSPSVDAEVFSYDGSVVGVEAPNAECIYDLYPEGSILFDSLFTISTVDYASQNNYWLLLDSIRQVKESQIPGSPLIKQKKLAEEIDQIEILQSDIVGKALSSISSNDESIESTWLSRSNSGIQEYSEYLALWYKRDFTKLDSIVRGHSDPDAETLLEAIEFLKNCLGRGTQMDSLSKQEIDTLMDIAKHSYGNYSNIVRNYLCLVYDKSIGWPQIENGLIPRSSRNDKKKISLTAEQMYDIRPNPSEGCLSIVSKSDKAESIQFQIFSTVGSIVHSGRANTNETICFDDFASGLYFVRIMTDKRVISETHKLIIQ